MGVNFISACTRQLLGGAKPDGLPEASQMAPDHSQRYFLCSGMFLVILDDCAWFPMIPPVCPVSHETSHLSCTRRIIYTATSTASLLFWYRMTRFVARYWLIQNTWILFLWGEVLPMTSESAETPIISIHQPIWVVGCLKLYISIFIDERHHRLERVADLCASSAA